MSNRSSPMSGSPSKIDSNYITTKPKKKSFSISSILGAETPESSTVDRKDDSSERMGSMAEVQNMWLPAPREAPKLEDSVKPMFAQNPFMRGMPWLGNPYLLQTIAHGKFLLLLPIY